MSPKTRPSLVRSQQLVLNLRTLTENSVTDISDIAADILKPLFVIGCIITALAFMGTLVAERWLRHRGRLTHESTTAQKVLAGLAIFGSVLGGAGLILLAGFDTKRYTTLHRLFLGLFMLGVALSAIFTVVEVSSSFFPYP